MAVTEAYRWFAYAVTSTIRHLPTGAGRPAEAVVAIWLKVFTVLGEDEVITAGCIS